MNHDGFVRTPSGLVASRSWKKWVMPNGTPSAHERAPAGTVSDAGRVRRGRARRRARARRRSRWSRLVAVGLVALGVGVFAMSRGKAPRLRSLGTHETEARAAEPPRQKSSLGTSSAATAN